MTGINLERVLDGVAHLLGEAIKVRARPSAKTPDRVTEAPKVGRAARSLDFSGLSEGRKRGPDVSALSRPAEGSRSMTWPVASLGHAIDGVRHRLFGSANASVEPEISSWVMHHEVPGAVGHPSEDRGACGLCIRATQQGRIPVADMVPVCPGCFEGGRHERDCPLVLADHDIRDEDWIDLPGQPRFEEWASDNERRGFLL